MRTLVPRARQTIQAGILEYQRVTQEAYNRHLGEDHPLALHAIQGIEAAAATRVLDATTGCL